MLSKRCVSTTHHGVLIYTPQKHILSCVILRTKGVLGEHTMVCSGNTLVFTVYVWENLTRLFCYKFLIWLLDNIVSYMFTIE